MAKTQHQKTVMAIENIIWNDLLEQEKKGHVDLGQVTVTPAAETLAALQEAKIKEHTIGFLNWANLAGWKMWGPDCWNKTRIAVFHTDAQLFDLYLAHLETL